VSTSPKESMFSTLHSVWNSLKSHLLHFTSQLNSLKGRAKVRDGIISGTIFLGTISVGQQRLQRYPKISA